MAGSNFLLQHWQEQYTIFLDNLARIRVKPAKKPVHDIRVALKKLKSMVRFAALSTGAEPAKFETIQQFFRLTGKYRDADMSLSLLNKTGKDEKIAIPSFSSNLRAMLRATRKSSAESAALPHEAELDTISEWIKERLTAMTNDDLDKKTEEQGLELLKDIQPLVEKFSHNAHAIRKKLKRLFYWLKQCPVNPFFDNKQMKAFDRTLTALGNWHDYFVVNNKLRKFRKEYLIRKTAEYDHAKKMEQVFNFMQVQWLAEADDKLGGLMQKQ